MLHAVLLFLGILNGLCRVGDGSYDIRFICVYEGEEYLQGERIYIAENACLLCECSPMWGGIDDCSIEQCAALESYGSKSCIQIYYSGVCCPELQCPEETLSGRRRRELFDVVTFTTPMPPTSIPTISLCTEDVVDIDETGTNSQGVTPLPVANGFVLHIQASCNPPDACYRYIQLQFLGFDMSEFHPEVNCTRQTNTNADILQSHLPEDDSLMPYLDIVDGGLEMKAWRLCGMKEGGIFTSLTDQAHILFRPGTHNVSSFTIKASLRNGCCGGVVSLDYDSSPFSLSNIITSPNYPDTYLINDHCTYTIKVDSPYKPVCTVFDLTVSPFEDCFDESRDVLKDTLMVGDSNTILDGETWCGQVSPFAVMSAEGENEIQVHWRTKDHGPNRGFFMTCMATNSDGIPKYESEASCTCGADTSSSGGTQYPFLVKIENSGNGVDECTAVLISKSFVLALGKCVIESVKNRPLFELTITLGADDPGGGVVIPPYDILDIIFPDKCGTSLEECLALVYIPEVTFTPYLQPVCLPLYEVLDFSSEDVVVTAFAAGGKSSRTVTQKVNDPRFCDIMLGTFSSRLICTFASSSTSLCNGEEGGALLVWEDPTDLRPKQQNIFPTVSNHWVLHGINMIPTCDSFTSPVLGSSYSDVYIKVSPYLYWITDVLSTAGSQICARPSS